MSACKIIEPKYHEVTPGHFVACHLYDEDVLSRKEELDLAYAHVQEIEEREKEIAKEHNLSEILKEKFEKTFGKKKEAVDATDEKNEDVETDNKDEYVGFDAIQNQEVTHVLEDDIVSDGDKDVKDEE